MTLYFDCFSGIAGDMTVAALADLLELSSREILQKVEKWGLPVKVELNQDNYSGLTAKQLEVHPLKELKHPLFSEVKEIIESLKEKNSIKERTLEMLKALYEAEASVHGTPFSQTHLHEAGGWDAIFDLLAVSWLIEELGEEKILHSPVNLGSGTIRTEHGHLPVPPPAVVELLKGRRVFSFGPEAELTTPTGAAILKILATEGKIPLATLVKAGKGGGKKKFEGFPNLLRVFLFKEDKGERDFVMQIETQMDDITGEQAGRVVEKISPYCLDAFYTPIYMKKGRPGILLTILCEPEKAEKIINIVFRESPTLGLRYELKPRVVLERKFEEVEVFGERVKIKTGFFAEELVTVKPEYESCKKIADKYNISLKEVCEKALLEFWRKKWKSST